MSILVRLLKAFHRVSEGHEVSSFGHVDRARG